MKFKDSKNWLFSKQLLGVDGEEEAISLIGAFLWLDEENVTKIYVGIMGDKEDFTCFTSSEDAYNFLEDKELKDIDFIQIFWGDVNVILKNYGLKEKRVCFGSPILNLPKKLIKNKE